MARGGALLSRRKVATTLLVAALTLAVGLAVLLARQLDAVGERYTETSRLLREAHPGMYVPEYTTRTLDGEEVTLGAEDERQLLYFLTTSCPYCRASLPVWKDLARGGTSDAQASGIAGGATKVRVIGVVLDSLHLAEAYRHEHGLEFPIVVLEGRRYAVLYRVSGVPLTMVVDGRLGRVLHARLGQLTEPAAIDSIRAALATPIEVGDLPVAPPPSVGGLGG